MSAPTKWNLPNYSIQPNEYLLIWCDRDLHQSNFHSNFKLNASGEEVALFKQEDDGIRWVDAIEFPPLPSDFSFGREVDAQNPWILFSNSTPGASNNTALSVLDAEKSETSIYPNPTTDVLHFNQLHQFFIISTDGRIVAQGRVSHLMQPAFLKASIMCSSKIQFTAL